MEIIKNSDGAYTVYIAGKSYVLDGTTLEEVFDEFTILNYGYTLEDLLGRVDSLREENETLRDHILELEQEEGIYERYFYERG